jgi:hypothetical protein
VTEILDAKEIQIRIDGIDPKGDAGRRMSHAVRRAVLDELIQLELVPDFHVRFPRDWIGLVVIPQSRLQ